MAVAATVISGKSVEELRSAIEELLGVDETELSWWERPDGIRIARGILPGCSNHFRRPRSAVGQAAASALVAIRSRNFCAVLEELYDETVVLITAA